MKFTCSIACLLLVYSWLCGVYLLPKWHALFPVVALALHVALTRRVLAFNSRIASGFLLFPVFYVLLLSFFQLTQFWEGAQGVDFTIFVQSIDQCSRSGVLATSLLGLRFTNFLTHHFSPILYAPSALAAIGIDAPYAAIALHGITISAMMYIAFLIARESNWRSGYGAVAVSALFLHPALRVGLSWEVRDEIFALPFIGLGYLFMLRGRCLLAVVPLLIAMACKETFFVIAPAVALCGILHHRTSDPRTRRMALVSFSLCVTIGAAATVLYFKILPGSLFVSTFDPTSRIGELGTLLSKQVLLGKLEWTFKFLVPFCFLPLLFPIILKYSLPALVPICAIAVTGFEPMWNPMAYYSVAPAYIVGLATIIGIGRSFPAIADCALDCRWILISFLASLSIGTPHNPAREVVRGIRMRALAAELQQFVPADSTIVANDYDLALFWNAGHLTRMYHAGRERVVFDYVVSRVGQEAEIPGYIKAGSHECFRNAVWFVRCAASNSNRAAPVNQLY